MVHSVVSTSFPCIQLTRLKFEWTNQDSVGGKNSPGLHSLYVNKKSIEVGQLFSVETASNIHKKKFFQKPYPIVKNEGFELDILSLHASSLAPLLATRS